MRGLASILLVLLFAIACLTTLSIYSSGNEHSAQTSSYVLELERAYYSKADFMHSILQTMSYGASKGNNREERAENAISKLNELDKYLENKNSIIWCGVISESELNRLPKRMVREKKPLLCDSCWDISSKTIIYDEFPEKSGRITYKCLSFFDVDELSGKIGVSKGGLSTTKDPEVFFSQFSGKYVIGISHYDELTDIASIGIVPEGTWVGYT